jgi:FdhD protein
MTGANQPIEYLQFETGRQTKYKADIIVETPVSLTVNGELWLTFMCTPVELEAMAVGFLFNEGLIQSADEVEDVRLCAAGDNVDVWLNHSAEKPSAWRRTSGCTGGMTSIEVELKSLKTAVVNGHVVSERQITSLVEKLFESQDLYKKTGGVHTSILSDGENVILIAEDIGRHNTLDKIAGRYVLDRMDVFPRILLTTGRISSEMLQKANRIGSTVLISRTSPSSLSIKMASDLGITLIGYARRDRFRVYTHPERILIHASKKQFEKSKR